MPRHTTEFRNNSQRSRLDRDAETVISLCGWLVAVVFVVGFIRGWWWGGDLHNLLWGLGGPTAEAIGEPWGWPALPVLTAALGAVGARWAWLALADLVCGIDPRVRHRGWRL